MDHKTITTPVWCDGHLHLREDWETTKLAPLTARFCSHAIVMPNLATPIDNPELLRAYKQHCQTHLGPDCQPLMTVYLTPALTPHILRACRDAGAFAIKVYPQMQTTNSHLGLSAQEYTNPSVGTLAVLAEAQKMDMPVLWHGEMPGTDVQVSEARFIDSFCAFSTRFPDLRMTFEHVSDADTIDVLHTLRRQGRKVACTITMHHLWMRRGLTDMVRPKLKPDWFFMPIAKTTPDWHRLVDALQYSWCFLGTDSAAHQTFSKHCTECCPGAFTAIHPEMLIETMEDVGKLDYLVPFTSTRMRAFYGLPAPTRTLQFVRSEWETLDIYYGYRPFLAKHKLRYQLKD